MKWIFALLILFSLNVFAVSSTPAKQVQEYDSGGQCDTTGTGGYWTSIANVSACKDKVSVPYTSNPSYKFVWTTTSTTPPNTSVFSYIIYNSAQTIMISSGSVLYKNTTVTKYVCPPDDKPTYIAGPVDLNGSKVCQAPPKVCMMGAILRVDKDGNETCFPNCGSAAGLAHSSQYFFQAGPTTGSTAGDVACYGQCSIKTVGGGIQLASGAWTGNFTFTGAACSVVRPEPTVDSESNTSSNGSATPVDDSTTSQATTDALSQLGGAASSAVANPVQPTATGPDGTATLKDVTKTVADSANAQIKATATQNVATGNLMSNISKDLQNTIIKSAGGGASASLQAQGNGKLDGISTGIGAGNGKLDGIQSTLNDIADKLDEPGEEAPFVPGAGSGAYWESILPESSFTEIKAKQDESIQQMKDLASEFQSSIQMTDLSASGEPDEWSLNMYGTALPFGMGAFQMVLDMGLAALILFLCALYAIYIIANRK